jgi:hypothetical protein
LPSINLNGKKTKKKERAEGEERGQEKNRRTTTVRDELLKQGKISSRVSIRLCDIVLMMIRLDKDQFTDEEKSDAQEEQKRRNDELREVR